MSESDLLHKALYFALLDLRSHGQDNVDSVTFRLADLFHNTVLQMGKAAAGTESYSKVLADLKTEAKAKGCEEWLNNLLSQIAPRTSAIDS